MKEVLLIILDGFGVRGELEGNAILKAHTPVLDGLFRRYPHTELKASGLDVGLPAGQMGNSEVGHLNIGAGRVVPQDVVRIDQAIEDGSLFENSTLQKMFKECKKRGKALHILGLCSEGRVHCSLSHVLALCKAASRLELNVFLHLFGDGRDTQPGTLPSYLTQVEKAGLKFNIATLTGRYYAMDRDCRWDRTRLAFSAIAKGEGLKGQSIEEALEIVKSRKETDEFITPIVIGNYRGLEKGDLCIIANYRADRVRQIAMALGEKQFFHFERGREEAHLVTMTLYDETFDFPILFPPLLIRQALAEVLASHGLAQLHMAESEKYAHVTYFFNGGDEKFFPLEERIFVASPREAGTYDQCPQMSAKELTDTCIQKIRAGNFSFVVLNFANPDMVGHTGVFEATVRAVEMVDSCIGNLLDAWLTSPSRATFITADHGNAEMMIDPASGDPHTSHTTNLVPFLAVSSAFEKSKLRSGGRLADVMPTVLEVMELPIPVEVTGKTLFV